MNANIEMEEVPFLRISTFVLLSLPIPFPISLIVTIFVMEVPLPVLVLWAMDFAVGDDGRKRGHWLNVHHGLLEGVWEIREIKLRAEWEWGELVHHD